MQLSRPAVFRPPVVAFKSSSVDIAEDAGRMQRTARRTSAARRSATSHKANR